jgi:hypothetical protein
VAPGSPRGEDERDTTDRHPAGRWWLVVPVVGLYIADLAFTLAGQPPSYWAGEYATGNEINPVGQVLLAVSPWLFFGAAVGWLVVVTLVALLWRHRFAEVGAKVLAAGHAIGGACWLARHGGWWFLAGCGYLAVAAVFTHWCWRQRDRTP